MNITDVAPSAEAGVSAPDRAIQDSGRDSGIPGSGTALAPGTGARRAARWLLFTSIALPLFLFIAAAGYDQLTLAREARARLSANTAALAEQTSEALQSVDLTLARVLDRLSGMEWQTIATAPAVHDFLARMQRESPQIAAIFLVDPSGTEAASSAAFPDPPVALPDRPYFAAAINGATGLMVTPPGPRHRRVAAFTLSRARISDGAFDGVVAVAVSRSVLGSFLHTIVGPGQGRAEILDARGQVLLADPPAAALTPQDPIDLAALPVAGAPALVRTLHFADGTKRLAGMVGLPRLGLAVLVTQSKVLWLPIWYAHMAILGVFALLAGGALWLTSWLVLEQSRRTEAQLQMLLVETERRQEAEQALLRAQKMEALGRLSGGVAHDFNNLLAAILGGVELAARRVAEPERVLRLLATIRQAAERGATLTAQMLTFSRNREVSRQPVDVNQVLGGIEDLLRRTAGPLVRVTYDLSPGLARALADPVQLEMALLNLVMNARDAMPLGGELLIRTDMAPAPEPNGAPRVLIAVRDTGEGMPEQVRASAFEPFFTTRGPGKGTGLGLSMVYGFVEQMGGAAQIASRFGEGTTVSLFLQSAPAVAAPAAIPAGLRGAAPERRLDVLLVDDDAVVRAMTREMLIEQGHRVNECAGGREALDLLRDGRRFDLLLIDFAMPTMNGSEVAAEARRIDPALPILFMTGYVENDALNQWAELGVRTIAKPFQMAVLAAALADAVSGEGGQPRVVPLRRTL